MFSVSTIRCLIVLGTVVSVSRVSALPPSATDGLFQTTLEKWTTTVQLTGNDANGDNVDSAAGPDYVADVPLLPPVFQARVFSVWDTTVYQAYRLYFDYPNQRIAAYGLKSGNATISKIMLCKSNVMFVFNATWCTPILLKCVVNRQFMPLTARYAASFTLGQSVSGIPAMLWTIRMPPYGYDVLIQRTTNAPVQVIGYDNDRGDVSIDYYTDLKLTVDPSAFYVPPQCRPHNIRLQDTPDSLRFSNEIPTNL